MKKMLCGLVVLVLLLSGCAKGETKTFGKLADFDGAKVGSLTGAVFAEFVDKAVKSVEHSYYNNLPDQVAALTSGKVDAIALDKPVAELLVAQNTSLVIFPEKVADDRYGFAILKNSKLKANADAALKKLKDNGTLAELADIWFSADESKKVLSELNYKKDFDGSAGTLKYGLDTTLVPMSYVGEDGKPIGFDVDIIRRIAYEMNMKIELVPMKFGALLESLASGNVDMVGGCMSITAERLKSVDFVGPYYEGGIVLVVAKDSLAASGETTTASGVTTTVSGVTTTIASGVTTTASGVTTTTASGVTTTVK